MIQDILPKKYDNTYRDILPEPQDTALVYHKGKILLRRNTDGTIAYPAWEELGASEEFATYLFAIDQERFFTVSWMNIHVPAGYELAETSVFRYAEPKHRAFAGITGFQLYKWYKEHRFCGKCSSALLKDHKERMLKCPHCGTMVYPIICPAVIVAVIAGDRILLSKYAGRSAAHFALIAGFTEIGETIEETVRREVMEEVGLRVKNLKFYKSQPWSFSGTLLFGFFAELDGPEEIRLQEDELAEAGFYRPEEVELDDANISLTREMMALFRDGYNPYQKEEKSGDV